MWLIFECSRYVHCGKNVKRPRNAQEIKYFREFNKRNSYRNQRNSKVWTPPCHRNLRNINEKAPPYMDWFSLTVYSRTSWNEFPVLACFLFTYNGFLGFLIKFGLFLSVRVTFTMAKTWKYKEKSRKYNIFGNPANAILTETKGIVRFGPPPCHRNLRNINEKAPPYMDWS